MTGKIEPKDEIKFIVRLANCGTNKYNCSYKMMESTNPAGLIYNAAVMMAEDMVGRELMTQLHLTVGLNIVKKAGLKADADLKDLVEKSNGFMESWDPERVLKDREIHEEEKQEVRHG